MQHANLTRTRGLWLVACRSGLAMWLCHARNLNASRSSWLSTAPLHGTRLGISKLRDRRLCPQASFMTSFVAPPSFAAQLHPIQSYILPLLPLLPSVIALDVWPEPGACTNEYISECSSGRIGNTLARRLSVYCYANGGMYSLVMKYARMLRWDESVPVFTT